MNDETGDGSATSSASQAGHERHSWLSSDIQGHWWSPSSPNRGRIVDQDTGLRRRPASEAEYSTPFLNGERQELPFMEPELPFKGRTGGAAQHARAVRWRILVSRVAISTPAAFSYIVILLLLVVLVVLVVSHSPWTGNTGAKHNPVQGSHAGARVAPTRTPLPPPTATPAQTELDGVITIQNLDNDATFDGDVQVFADTGRLYCRNAPLPNSTWHIVLAGGASTTVPCIIPVSMPATLPTHTFTTVEVGQNGEGRVLVDNLTPFQGTAYYPTPVRYP